MNYATWKLNFANAEYGTGPEDAIIAVGNTAEGAWSKGDLAGGGVILGYVTNAVDESELSTWQVKNVTQEEALAFCQSINSAAYLTEDGRITAPIELAL